MKTDYIKRNINDIECGFNVQIIKDGKYFVANVIGLDLTTYAKDLKTLHKRITEVIDIFLEELKEMDTLEEVLLELGYQNNFLIFTRPPMRRNLLIT